MNKKECIVKSAYVRKDESWNVICFVVSVQNVNKQSDKDYTYRFDYSKEWFKKMFNKDESNINSLIGSKVYLVESLSLN